MTSEKTSIDQHLENLWQQGARDIAIAFLERAITLKTTLSELGDILRFDAVRPELMAIKLGDVLRPNITNSRSKSDVEQNEYGSSKSRAPAKRRKRRSAQDTKQMNHLLMEALRASETGLTTPQLCKTLAKAQYTKAATVVTTLLRTLESEGHIASDNGRPKTWRTQG